MSTAAAFPAGRNARSPQRTLFGHPMGLYVLFGTELWERFSFYGMKALLILYMTKHLVWEQQHASSIMGWYQFGVYAMPVIGGLIADRWLGAYRTVFAGALLLCVGHFLMAFEPIPAFFSALTFIVLGVGLLKPNVSTQVASLYGPADPRRDAAYTIFYMGINVGAFLGPIVCGQLRLWYNFHVAFAAAGVGMLVSLVFYAWGRRLLQPVTGDADLYPADVTPVDDAHPAARADRSNVLPYGVPTDAETKVTRDRVFVLLIVFAFVILFWMAFEQSSNAMSLWANDYTNLQPFSGAAPPASLDQDAAASGGFAITAEQTQSINPFWIISLSPLVALIWTFLGRRGREPSTPGKMAMGLLFMGVAFAPMIIAARYESAPTAASLASLPQGVKLDKYGATRLRFDSSARMLRMEGVLTPLDRLKLLAETAPTSLHSVVEELAKLAEDKDRTAAKGEVWRVSVKVVSDRPISLAAEPIKGARWDAASSMLSVDHTIDAPHKLAIVAAAADPAFKQAVDAVFLSAAVNRVTVWWLILHYLLATLGELCLSPIGLSLVTKLSPTKWVGMLMGGWFLATAIANKMGHMLGELWGSMPPERYFRIFIITCCTGGLLLATLVRPLKRMMHGVK